MTIEHVTVEGSVTALASLFSHIDLVCARLNAAEGGCIQSRELLALYQAGKLDPAGVRDLISGRLAIATTQ